MPLAFFEEMDPHWVKTLFFFSVGIFTIFPWNSILNLAGYFQDSFQDPTISQSFTFWYFLFTLVAIYLSIIVDKNFQVFKSTKVVFFVILAAFNTIFFVCEFMPINRLKYFLFYLQMVLLSASHFVFENLTTGLSARFTDNEGMINFQGRAVSGLICNFIMIFCILGTPAGSTATGAFVYLLIGDAGMILFYFLMGSFFRHCLAETYMKDKSEQFLEGVFEMENVSDKPPTPTTSKTIPANDIRKNHDEATLPYSKIFLHSPLIYLGTAFNVTITLWCYPVLIFRLDIGVTGAMKFAILSLIFNLGDIVARYFYDWVPVTNALVIHLANVFRVVYIWIFLASIDNQSTFLATLPVKIANVFLFAFVHGVLTMRYFEMSGKGFESPFDRNRSGNMVAIGLESGLMMGAILARLW